MVDTKVEEVMTNLVVTLKPEDSVHYAAQRLAHSRISGAPVVEDGKVIGMVSEADLVHAVVPPATVDRGFSIVDMLQVMTTARPRAHPHGLSVSEVMSPLVVSVGPGESIWAAAERMEHRGIKRLPVVDDEGYLMGIISRADIVRSVARSDADIARDVEGAIRILGDDVIESLDVEVHEGVATVAGLVDRRSTHDLAIKLAARALGVVEVVDELDFRFTEHAKQIPRRDDVLAPSTPRAS